MSSVSLQSVTAGLVLVGGVVLGPPCMRRSARTTCARSRRSWSPFASSGNVPAAKEVLNRCLGRSVEADFVERLDQLAEALATRGQR
jgi:hypothetical protein